MDGGRMISRSQLLQIAKDKAPPTRKEMLEIFCRHFLNNQGPMEVNVSLIQAYSKELLAELEEE